MEGSLGFEGELAGAGAGGGGVTLKGHVSPPLLLAARCQGSDVALLTGHQVPVLTGCRPLPLAPPPRHITPSRGVM